MAAMQTAAVSGTGRRTRVTRALYAIVVAVAPALALYLLVAAWARFVSALDSPLPWSEPSPPWYTTLVALGFILPGCSAWIRVLLGGEIIPAGRFAERPVVAGLVALCTAVAVGMLVLNASIYADVVARGGCDDCGGPMMFFAAIMATAAALALLIGELALVAGRDS
jgi:hypothetical protein